MEAVRAVVKMNIERKRGSREPKKKKKWFNVIESDISAVDGCVDDMED